MALSLDRTATVDTRTFEIQREVGGRWLLDSIADDRQIAINVANGLLRSGRAPRGVQVVAVQPMASGQFKEVRVYRATPEDQRNADADAERQRRRAAALTLRIDRVPREISRDGAARAARPAPTPQLAAAVKSRQESVLRARRATLVLIGFALAWCSIFYFWRQPATPWAFDSPAAQRQSAQPNSFESKFRTIFSH